MSDSNNVEKKPNRIKSNKDKESFGGKKTYRDRDRDRDRDGDHMQSKRQRIFFKRKICRFCNGSVKINYKDADILRRFTTERGKIIPRRITGTCAKHQRRLAKAIKRARILALLPFVEKFR
ncbi:MAG: 30S ribosomal protein S18 [Spirochaetales bacterium]|nr:30S ribosomal protein S18 [Spirochaetales bacterium]